MQKYYVKSASITEDNDRCTKKINIMLLQVVKDKMMDYDINRSKRDALHIFINNQKGEGNKDMEVHL